MKYTAVIFGLEGALLNDLADLTVAVNNALESQELSPVTEAEVADCTGQNPSEFIRDILPTGTHRRVVRRVVAPFKDYFSSPATEKTVPHDGIVDLLDKLKDMGVKVAAVSRKSPEIAKEMAKKSLGDRLDTVIGEKIAEEGEPEPKKMPAPDAIFSIMEELGVNGRDLLLVGDTVSLTQTARNAGVKSVSVTWGVRTKRCLENHGVTEFIDTPNELLAML